MRRELDGGIELDDDPARIDVDTVWVLHTRDAHGLYRKVGFGEPSERVMERS